MQDRVEPPILVSRLLTFVMATALVVLVVLIITLDKMFPLNRPQIFFLKSQSLADKELTLTEMPADLDLYKRQFIREYVRERNEIVPDLAIMRAKWANNDNGVIKTRSTDEVFGKFAMTDMANIIRQDLDEAFDITCNVDFFAQHSVVEDRNINGAYVVSFNYVCSYGPMADQTFKRQYKLRVQLETTAKNAVKWAERMENPLGLRVSKYEVIDRQNKVIDDDPLNWIRVGN